MAAIITRPVGAQNFETIRDQLVLVIGTEYAAQRVLQPTLPAVQRVYTERCVPVDASHEVPMINVTTAKGDYDNYTINRADGHYMYNIDVYTNAYTTSSTDGDKKAMLDMTRIMGIVRAILSYPDYDSLGLARGIIIGIPRVRRMYVANKDMAEDALFNVVGRVQLEVRMIESTKELMGDGVPLKESGTTNWLKEDTTGFFYEIQNLDA